MNFSKNDFDRNAKALLSAFAFSKKERKSDLSLSTDCFNLIDWYLCDDTNGSSSSYLSHPPITVSSTSNEKSRDHLLVTQETDDTLEDENIFIDDQCYVDLPIMNSEGKQQSEFLTIWTFSILYSTTYQTPVLYFYVQEMDGNPVGRQLLLKLLRQAHCRSMFEFSNDFPTDTWEFISQEEHPVTGISSFFVHPCQSARRLQLLTSAKSVREDVDKKLQKPLSDNSSTKNDILWAWMSMIFPAVGHSIPSVYFRHIQKFITEQPQDA